MNDNSSRPTPREDRLTDSPWFWLALFSATGLAALLIVGPKYNKRQRIIENKFLADQERGRPPAADSQEVVERPAPARGPAEDVLIPLWPLVALTAVLMAIALAGLARTRWTATSSEIPREEPR